MRSSSFFNHMAKFSRKFFFGFGVLMFLLIVGGLLSDLSNFDRTKGGYEPPYENYTGEPINFDELDQSKEGIIGRGYILDFHLNCTTGMISFEAFNQKVDYRVVSERAIKVHKPREACSMRGFEPKF